ncbi:MAG: TetR/AcrR family transcriptional regulator [Bacteroidota bacterium]
MEFLKTEEKIKRAAAKVFTQKGYKETTTRDIAEAAQVKLGSLHYYFRSKEKLFQIVAEEAMKEFAQIMDVVFREDIPLKEKIRQYVEKYTDFFKENPFIPMFILSESERNPDNLYRLADFKSVDDRLRIQLEEAIEAGEIRSISTEDFIANLVGMTIFPFLSKRMMCYAADLTSQQFDTMIDRRKELVPEMIISYLFK